MDGVPRFLELRGCINCPASQEMKRRTGREYGFDHEVMASCLIAGCVDEGVDLLHPFLDPDEVISMARERGDAGMIANAEKYAQQTRGRFASYYALVEPTGISSVNERPGKGDRSE